VTHGWERLPRVEQGSLPLQCSRTHDSLTCNSRATCFASSRVVAIEAFAGWPVKRVSSKLDAPPADNAISG
jgi:hypothetical protein